MTGFIATHNENMKLASLISKKELTVFITSDTHYLSKDLHDNGKAFETFYTKGDGKILQYMEEITDAFLSEVKKSSPDVLILSGDLTNNGEIKSHEDLAKKLKSVTDKGVKVYVIPGNHDINNPYARRFEGDKQYRTDYVSEKEFLNIYKSFGYDEAISKDTNSLSYLVAPSKDLYFLMVDSCLYQDNVVLGFPMVDGQINQGTMKWIESCANMAKENNAKVIAVMHHNIMQHSELIHKGYTLNNSKEVLDLFQKLNINTVFSGHIHTQSISTYGEGEDVIREIVSSALPVYPVQYGVFHIQNNKFDYATKKVDVSAWAKENKINDKNLIEFTTFSEQFFADVSTKKMREALINSQNNYSEEEMTKIIELCKELNINYFAGTQSKIRDKILNSDAYQILENSDNKFLKSYLKGILDNGDKDNNHVSFIIK